jgi:hypothetical protein
MRLRQAIGQELDVSAVRHDHLIAHRVFLEEEDAPDRNDDRAPELPRAESQLAIHDLKERRLRNDSGLGAFGLFDWSVVDYGHAHIRSPTTRPAKKEMMTASEAPASLPARFTRSVLPW